MARELQRKAIPESVQNVVLPEITTDQVDAKFKPIYDEVKKKVIELNPEAANAPWDQLQIKLTQSGIEIDIKDGRNNKDYIFEPVRLSYKGLHFTKFMRELGFPAEIARSRLPELQDLLRNFGIDIRTDPQFPVPNLNDEYKELKGLEYTYAFGKFAIKEGAGWDVNLTEGSTSGAIFVLGEFTEENELDKESDDFFNQDENYKFKYGYGNAHDAYMIKVYDDAYIDNRTDINDKFNNKPSFVAETDFVA